MEERRFDLGPLSYRVQGGALRGLSWRGVEVLRGLSAPVRDTSWGTLPEEGAGWSHHAGAERAVHERRFGVAGGALSGRLRIEAWARGRLVAELELTAARGFETNRAGFCLLHPLRGVAGTPFVARGPDGAERAGRFPERISPGQPAMGLAGLSHDVGGVRVEIAMEGEVFEMEDQRNWSDASFKTYCRPLSRPLPQRIAAGETLRQRIEVTLSGKPVTGAAPAADAGPVRMPEILLAVEPGWLPEAEMTGTGVLMRWGPEGWKPGALARLRDALAGRPLDLEAVVPQGAAPSPALRTVAEALDAAGLCPRHVVALPEPYLRSYQPDGPWPDGPTPEDALAAARAAFPAARIGAGMLTNFTELNRRPPEGGAYITHGNAAIVHAADDESVLETLEALPDVLASARAIAGERGLRLGLAAIGMRSNPYGAGLAPNPEGSQTPMTDADPRQGAPFAAAYAVAVCALAARAGAEAVTLAAAAGPLGAEGRPVGVAVAALATLAGREARIDGTPPGPLRIEAGGRALVLDAADAAPRWEDAP
jgi:hypothetical protein